MNCEICRRSHHPHRLPFLCAVDARNRLYEGRIAHATALIENDTLEQRINSALTDPDPSSSDEAAAKTVHLERLKSGEAQAMDRTSQIIAQADKLRADVEAARRDIEERKKKIATMNADMDVATYGANPRRARHQEDVERTIQMTRYKWNRSFEDMAATRSFLCMEAARLYGLRRIKKSNSVKYQLGGIEMTELPGMISRSLLRRAGPSNLLTVSSRITRGYIDVSCPYRAYTNAGISLPGNPPSCGDHASPP